MKGGEQHLKDVDNDLLRKFDRFAIEMHGEQIARELSEKFEEAGFRKEVHREYECGSGELELTEAWFIKE